MKSILTLALLIAAVSVADVAAAASPADAGHISSGPAATSPAASAAAGNALSPGSMTPAERSEYRSTPNLETTVGYLEGLAERSPFIHLSTFGTSGQGRSMPLVVVSTDRAFSPAEAHATGKPIVMLQSGIHAGEIDGKDASLALLRDIAEGTDAGLIDGLILLILPVYNVDGHERISPYNRANQNGPVDGMGFRTNARGLDLNRDHLKLESPEAQALVSLVTAWQPHLHVDQHVTNGSDHDWILTWSWAEAPQMPGPVDRWMKEAMPRVMAATEAAGHRTGPYVSLIERMNPRAGMSSWVGEARYSGGYFPLRSIPSILIEMHVYKPYGQRVKALRAFVQALLEEVGDSGTDSGARLKRAVESAQARVVEDGRWNAEPSTAVVQWRQRDTEDTIRWPVYAYETRESKALGAPLLVYRPGEFEGGDAAGIEVPWIHAGEAIRIVRRPRGYVVEPGWPGIVDRLRGHGLEYRVLEQPVLMLVEVLQLSSPKYATSTYQGQMQVQEVEVEVSKETVELVAGTIWVPADQPNFEVAVQLFEPQAPDSLLAWGYLSSIFERKEYIEPMVLEELFDDLMKDPEIRSAWEAAMADESFAANGGARWMWLYQRTPYWDSAIGRLPIYRALEVPPALRRGTEETVAAKSIGSSGSTGSTGSSNAGAEGEN